MGAVMHKIVAIALLAAAAALLIVGAAQTDASRDRPFQVAGCINGVCS